MSYFNYYVWGPAEAEIKVALDFVAPFLLGFPLAWLWRRLRRRDEAWKRTLWRSAAFGAWLTLAPELWLIWRENLWALLSLGPLVLVLDRPVYLFWALIGLTHLAATAMLNNIGPSAWRRWLTPVIDLTGAALIIAGAAWQYVQLHNLAA